MPAPCIVLIGATEQLPALTRRVHAPNGDLVTFADTEVLRALDAIMKRRPSVVALERLFAATPRGAALISRIKADPTLIHAEIRVIADDSDSARVSRLGTASGPETGGAASAGAVVEAPPQLLDQRGTRRAARFRIAEQVDIVVDGSAAALVDLSSVGAQVVSSSVLRPNQRVRVALADAGGAVRFNAIVVWASFEIPPKVAPRYRVGLEFVDAGSTAVDAFCQRHRL